MSDEYGHKLKGFTLRMEEDLKKKVQDSAKKNCRSESDEIRTRLKWSFDQEDKRDREMKEMKKSLSLLHEKLDYLLQEKS